MNKKLLLGLALVLGGILCGLPSIAQPTDVSRLQWGEMTGGFQMAAALGETNGLVHCWIRNATTNEMDYPSFDFGYAENISLEICGPTNWSKYRVWPAILPRSLGASSACPYIPKRIGPAQIVTNTYTRSRSRPWPVWPFADYLKWTHGNTNEALLSQKLNGWYASRDALETATGRGDTFAIDLFEMKELSSLPRTNSVEARISQSFRTKMGGGVVTLYSPKIMLSAVLLEACARENVAASVLHTRENKP
jgi:hypothetical protein